MRTRTSPLAPTAPRRPVALLALAALLATCLSAFGWAPPTLSADSTGDPVLAQRLRAAAGAAAVQGLAVSTGNGRTTSQAAIGRADATPGREQVLTATTVQEIGSVTKSMTGLLLAEAVERGEVTPGTTLGEVYPDRDLEPQLSATTLGELATHTSGLPRLSTRATVRSAVTALTHGNPYAWDTPDSLLRDRCAALLRGERGRYAYSNLGYALLGQALATRAALPYERLLQQRVLGPLGMTSTAANPDEPPAGRAHEVAADGRAVAPWLSSGSGPAGTGVFSTAADLGRLAAAAAAGSLPGAAALTPRAAAGAMTTGWGWFTVEVGGRTFVGNNGATYGVQTSLWLEPATGRWVAVTAPTGPGAAQDSETVAFRLLDVAV